MSNRHEVPERAWAARDLLARSGVARGSLDLDYAENTGWTALGVWPGSGPMSVYGARSMIDALEGLAARAYENAVCNHCAKLVHLCGLTDHLAALGAEVGGSYCEWRRSGWRWFRGCE